MTKIIELFLYKYYLLSSILFHLKLVSENYSTVVFFLLVLLKNLIIVLKIDFSF